MVVELLVSPMDILRSHFLTMKDRVSSQAIPFGAKSAELFAFPKAADKFLMRRRTFLGLACVFLAIHAAAIHLSHQSPGVSALFVLVCSGSAIAASYWRSTRSIGPVRRKWDFVASAISLWTIGEATSALRLFAPSMARVHILGPEFYFLVYGIPVLLAISSSNEERDTVLFVLIDSFQAIFAVALVYLELSLSQSAASGAQHPLNITLIYGIGTWTLAGACLLRVLARPGGEERALYRILLAYLCFFAVLATPVRQACVFNALPIGAYRDLLTDALFLLLTAGCLLICLDPDPAPSPIEMNSFALLLNNASPIFFTLAVLALGAMVARDDFGLGISAIAMALVLYCFRAALLQSAYISAQHALTRSQYALREANARLKQLSFHDALTGLPNRRQFDETLDLEWNRALRNHRPLSLLILDVDCFKALNDLRGHQTGDECLQKIAQALPTTLRRAGEVAARYGGEEFAAILPDVALADATSVAESMRKAVLALELPHEASTAERFLTISIGVAAVQPNSSSSPTQLLAAADEALYRAKRSGRNRVVAATPNNGAASDFPKS
jgi:diguanylate cyclase (GGDEF)-like protein